NDGLTELRKRLLMIAHLLHEMYDPFFVSVHGSNFEFAFILWMEEKGILMIEPSLSMTEGNWRLGNIFFCGFF
ncbi:MAG: hypothetical protein PVI62_08000, partial [Desulfobacterales bacterium]